MLAAHVCWKAKHLAREASPTRKLVTLSLIDRQLSFRNPRTTQTFNNEGSAFEALEISGKLAILCRNRLEDCHDSTLHFIKCHSVEFLSLSSMWNIRKAYGIVGSTKLTGVGSNHINICAAEPKKWHAR